MDSVRTASDFGHLTPKNLFSEEENGGRILK
jgi:hypothetical protein